LFITLDRPRLAPLIPPDFVDWLHELMAAAELVAITERTAACRDPKDDKFLELAVNGRADVLITDDRDLLALNPFRGVSRSSPRPTPCWTPHNKNTRRYATPTPGAGARPADVGRFAAPPTCRSHASRPPRRLPESERFSILLRQHVADQIALAAQKDVRP
jgi:hypothetical protein